MKGWKETKIEKKEESQKRGFVRQRPIFPLSKLGQKIAEYNKSGNK